MGTDNLFWKRKNNTLKRKSKRRGTPAESFLIVCEGEQTEPNYFRAFDLPSASVKVVGCARNTLSLVKHAIDIRKKAGDDDEKFDQTWCVFDRDNFTAQNFKEAFSLAGRNGIRTAYSNEAFELWYLLHFHYFNSAISRADYKKKLSDLMKESYKKNSTDMYHKLLNKQDTAIKHAKKLWSSYKPLKPEKANPSTTVHKLVIELNKHLPHTKKEA